jgi:ribosomal protein S18 acetylase RimI-like enzyme
MAVRADRWLAGVLGAPVHVVEPGGEPPQGPGLAYAKVPAADTAEVDRLAALGFRVVDVNVTLERRGPAERAQPASVVVAAERHAAALLDVAERSFRLSRFHLDPRIPGELADRVKREWVRSYLEGRRGLELLAALDGRGEAVGFLAVLEAGGARVIDLVAVAPEARGRGHGDALVAAFVARHAPAAERLLVGTQAANAPSIRLYEKHGFRFREAKLVMHRHGGPA